MIKAIIEMPRGTRFKYEIDKKDGNLILDRPVSMQVPYNYGFIPNTLCDDGDPLDVFIAATEAIPSLTEVKLDVVGIIRCIDDGKQDDKILAYVKDDIHSRVMISKSQFEEEVMDYLENYKKGLVVQVIMGEKEALAEISLCSNIP